MSEIIVWPQAVLVPARRLATQNAFSRGAGRTLGGVSRSIRTDLGYWSFAFDSVGLHTPAHRRAWAAIRTQLGGRAGVLAIPAWSFEAAPYISGRREPIPLTPHDDDTPFDDDTPYAGSSIVLEMETEAQIGATEVTLRIINAAPNLSGIRFSYQHALYETGVASEIDGDLWTVSIFPAIRQTIPAGASLECDRPTCLVHLARDDGMDGPLSPAQLDEASVEFVEAVDFWSDLAIEEA